VSVDEGMPTEPDVTRPSVARVYDYWLGGAANFAVDRELGDQMITIDPGIVAMARANRSFLRRVVTWLTHNGVDQFLDLGSGIPTVGNVHEVAQSINPLCRVAYVDNEPIAVAHSRSALRDNPNATITHADMRDTDAVLSAPGVAELLDFTRPVAVLNLLVLQYFPDSDDPAGIVARYRAALAPGSYVALTHATSDATSSMISLAKATQVAVNTVHPRTHAEVTALFGDLRPVEPGVVWVHDWRPEDVRDTATCGIYGGVARVQGPQAG
jgi:SAM-dependent methyltransferase